LGHQKEEWHSTNPGLDIGKGLVKAGRHPLLGRVIPVKNVRKRRPFLHSDFLPPFPNTA